MGEAALTVAELDYYFALSELNDEHKHGCIGAGIGSGITTTHELKVMSFHEAMASPDKMHWEASVQHEHEWMIKNEEWEVVDKHNVPKDVDVIDSMWAMKKKANGDYRAWLVAHGFKQTPGKSFIHHDISSPVVHDMMAQIVLVLMLIGSVLM